MPINDLETSGTKALKNNLKEFLDVDSQDFAHTVVMIDELFPDFPTSLWRFYKSFKKTDFVLALRHAFNDGLYVENSDTLPARVYQENETIFCRLKTAYRCTKQIIKLIYYLLVQSTLSTTAEAV